MNDIMQFAIMTYYLDGSHSLVTDASWNQVKIAIRKAKKSGDKWHLSPRTLAEKDRTLWLTIHEQSKNI